MGTKLVRFRDKNSNEAAWGVLEGDEVRPLASPSASLGQLLRERRWQETSGAARALASVELLAPITRPCKIICQGKNYLDHVIETGVKPANKEHNILFTKADSTLGSATDPVRRPAGVQLLDYEIELGLVMGKRLEAGAVVTEGNLHEYVAGFVMANDVSARDVQVPQRQWFKGKSFRGFCPVGPWVFLPTNEEFAKVFELDLELSVNGARRQKSNTKLLMNGPVATLQEIAGIFDLEPGDLLLTGTPGGVSMRVKPKSWWEEVKDALSAKGDKQKFAEFVAEQAESKRYLKNGDRVESTIRSADGSVDLGWQSWVVEG